MAGAGGGGLRGQSGNSQRALCSDTFSGISREGVHQSAEWVAGGGVVGGCPHCTAFVQQVSLWDGFVEVVRVEIIAAHFTDVGNVAIS